MKFQTMARAGIGVLKGRLFGVKHPLFVTLATNNSCQSHCKYCKIPKRSQRELTCAEIFRLIDEIVAFGVIRLGIWGGEPLLRPDIVDIVRHAHDKGLYVTLDTNGYLLPKKQELLKYLDHLIVSLDGPEQAHDANREPGSYRQAMAAIECVPSTTPVWTITVLTKNNINEIDWILDTAEEKHFIPTFQVLHHSDHFGTNDTLRPSPEEYRKCLAYLLEQQRKGRKMGISAGCIQHLLDWKDYTKNMSPDPGQTWNKCWGGEFFVNVDANGDMYPCSLVIGSVKAPNFLDKGFAAAYKEITPPPCRSCLATCFSENNMLFSLSPSTIWQWVVNLHKNK